MESIRDKIGDLEIEYMKKTGLEPNTVFLGEKQFEKLLTDCGIMSEEFGKMPSYLEDGKVGSFAGLDLVLTSADNCLKLGMVIE